MGLLDIEHRLIFRYDGFIHESWMELRVEPRSSIHQTVHSFYLAVGPAATVERYVDWNENYVHHFGVGDYHERIEVVTRSLVDVHPQHIPLSELTEPPIPVAGSLLDFVGFGGPIVRSPALEELGRSIGSGSTAPVGEQVRALSRALRKRVQYVPGVTDYRSNTDHALEAGSGVCQDFAHLLLGLLRLRGIPCRYVSGYLHVDQSGREPSQSHAWVELYVLTHGWVSFDPTHDQSPNDCYVSIGRGRHYDDTPPNRGIYRGNAKETLRAEVHTQRSNQRDVVGLHEQVETIEVPVHRELPSAARDRPRELGHEDPQQQQQQQQQSRRREPV